MIQKYIAEILNDRKFNKPQEVILYADHLAALKAAVKEKDGKFNKLLNESLIEMAGLRGQIATLTAENEWLKGEKMCEGKKIRIVFDGPPGPEGGRFIEVVGAAGESFKLGEWVEAGEYWYLEIPDFYARIAELEAELKEEKAENVVKQSEESGAILPDFAFRPDKQLTELEVVVREKEKGIRKEDNPMIDKIKDTLWKIGNAPTFAEREVNTEDYVRDVSFLLTLIHKSQGMANEINIITAADNKLANEGMADYTRLLRIWELIEETVERKKEANRGQE